MAGSRMEKLSTIFKRYTGLIKGGAVLAENRPVWYDVYEKFPPTTEPVIVRPEPEGPVRNIYYPEDILRSRFNRTYGDSATVFNTLPPTKSSGKTAAEPKPNASELFIGKYLQLAKAKAPSSAGIDLNDDALFKETEDAVNQEYGLKLRPKKEFDPSQQQQPQQ